jgi:hypothetical protein
MENKIVDRFLYEALVTDELLAKVEKIVTDSLKPFLGTLINPHTVAAVEGTIKNKLDELTRLEEIPDCFGYFYCAKDINSPSKIDVYYRKPYFKKTPTYKKGHTRYGIEDEVAYKYVVKEMWQEAEYIVYRVETTNMRKGTTITERMMEYVLMNKYHSISAAKEAERSYVQDRIDGLMAYLAGIDKIEED